MFIDSFNISGFLKAYDSLSYHGFILFQNDSLNTLGLLTDVDSLNSNGFTYIN